VRPFGWLLTWGSDASVAAPDTLSGPVWAHSEIASETRAFEPRVRQQIIVQTGSQFSTIPVDDTQRWPK